MEHAGFIFSNISQINVCALNDHLGCIKAIWMLYSIQLILIHLMLYLYLSFFAFIPFFALVSPFFPLSCLCVIVVWYIY